MELLRQLERYAHFVDSDLLAQIYQLADLLAGVNVLHLNTTAQGGGVAEILQELLPLMEGLGIKHRWKVIPLDEMSNLFTAHLVDLLQGNEPGDIAESDQHVYLDKLARTIHSVEDYQADLYVVHDFQLAPLAYLFPWMRPAMWFCHIDTANPNQNAKQYIRQFLDAYAVCAFNSEASVFQELVAEQTHVITLGIDPFRDKNRFLSRAQGKQILAQCGVDPAQPLITQVSRFGKWKNPWQTIDVYRLVKPEIPSAQLALVGALEAADDINALEVLADLQEYARGDRDIHLLSDPTLIKYQQVNAFQRYSSVILQRSSREGFGFTVTEAMWKYQPVVGTSATGLRTQIIHGYNGYIADETPSCAGYTLRTPAKPGPGT